MANIYSIIGNGDTRKSSIIRCLTGAARNCVFLVETNGAPIEVLVHLSSLQESYILPADLDAEITRTGIGHVLLPLWIRSRNATNPRTHVRVQLPDGEAYLNYLLSRQHRIMRPIVLFQGMRPHGFALSANRLLATPSIIDGSITRANNEMRETIKRIWSWH
jgi:hypothetical protein